LAHLEPDGVEILPSQRTRNTESAEKIVARRGRGWAAGVAYGAPPALGGDKYRPGVPTVKIPADWPL